MERANNSGFGESGQVGEEKGRRVLDLNMAGQQLTGRNAGINASIGDISGATPVKKPAEDSCAASSLVS